MLYFISTPVGNLKDITLRALEVLNEVDIIACEDTRTSLKLLNHYEIKKQLVSYHKFNEKQSGERLIADLKSGKNIAVITDAGTPVISDPGNVLTKMLVEEGIEYTVIPGATAFVPALILSGMDAQRFAFIGFLPEKKREQDELFFKYKNLDMTLIFYCAPHDLKKTVETLYKGLGERKAAAVKEITKLHESVERFNLSEGVSEENPRGEYVIIVEGGKGEENPNLSLSVEEHINLYIEKGMSKMDAVKTVAKERKLPKSEIYKYTL
ncbi:MAG: 16S rRNA (cytidine(1402)-2'-O)-methyltransferase [Clostridiales bacterium]|nr:16S rRNA (cytidine(1402)-2'-O)-methyltransferase [Clostridiales bacterium]